MMVLKAEVQTGSSHKSLVYPGVAGCSATPDSQMTLCTDVKATGL